MRALSIRQPYAELILRGEKTIEYRSRPTRLIGQRFYIYASKGKGQISGVGCQGRDCPPWCRCHLSSDIWHVSAPTGVIVGSASISHCEKNNGHYEWHLTGVKRLKKPRAPHRRPQPVWFYPY
jgi:predicted transcriptional regulator